MKTQQGMDENMFKASEELHEALVDTIARQAKFTCAVAGDEEAAIAVTLCVLATMLIQGAEAAGLPGDLVLGGISAMLDEVKRRKEEEVT